MIFWDDTGTYKVPKALWPACIQQGYPGNYKRATVGIIPFRGCGDQWMDIEDRTGECVAPERIASFCWDITSLHCDGGYTWACNLVGYFDLDNQNGNTDYDCDGTFDSDDPNPGTPDPKIDAEKGRPPGCNASTGTK
jgi:hypothetical protein